MSEGSLSGAIDQKDWLYREYTHALGSDRNLVPLIMEGFSYSAIEANHPELARFSAVQYHHAYFKASVQQLVDQPKH